MTELTDNVYWASLDPRIQHLRYVGAGQGWYGTELRNEQAQALALEGLLIDFVNVVLQYYGGPAQCMALRKSIGYTWVPAIGYPPIEAAPGITPPPGSGLKPYDPNKPWPLGSLIVSTDAADFPPFDK